MGKELFNITAGRLCKRFRNNLKCFPLSGCTTTLLYFSISSFINYTTHIFSFFKYTRWTEFYDSYMDTGCDLDCFSNPIISEIPTIAVLKCGTAAFNAAAHFKECETDVYVLNKSAFMR